MIPEADMSWKWSDYWVNGWETAAYVGSDCFICESIVLAACPTAHFWAALRTFGPTYPAKITIVHWRFLPGVFLSLVCPRQSIFILPKCTPSANIWILVTFCCELAGGTCTVTITWAISKEQSVSTVSVSRGFSGNISSSALGMLTVQSPVSYE